MGAAIAPGSQKWNGTCADLVSAPTRSSRIATTAIVPVPSRSGSAITADTEKVPAVTPIITMPTSMARPPNVVTISAVSAARRFAPRVGL